MKARNIFFVFLILLLIFFYKSFLFHQVIYCCDNLTLNIPSKLLLVEYLKRGQFPLWNPTIFSGVPFFADLNLGILFPLNFLYALLPSFQAITVEVILEYIIVFVGIFSLARLLKISSKGSLYTSIIFTFSGTVATYANNVSILHVLVLMPWVLWSFLRYLRSGKLPDYLIACLVFSLQIIAGHPQVMYLTGLLIFCFVVSHPKISLASKIRRSILFISLALGLSSIQLFPFVEFAFKSNRSVSGFSYSTSGAFPLWGIIRLLLPNSIGNLSGAGAWAASGSLVGYVGILPLIFCLNNTRKTFGSLFWIIVAAITFIASFGAIFPIYTLLYYIVPGIRFFRSPENFLVVYTLAIAVLAGYGFDNLLKSRIFSFMRKNTKLLFTASIIVVLLSLSLFFTPFEKYFVRLLGFLPFTKRIINLSFRDIRMIVDAFTINITLIGCFMTVLVISIRKFSLNRIQMVIIVLSSVELLIFSSHALPTISQKTLEAQFTSAQSIIKQISDFDSKINRILIDPSAIRNPYSKSFPKYDYNSESLWQIYVGKPNIYASQYQSADGYGSIVYTPYQQFIDKSNKDPTGVNLRWNSSLLNILGVKYVLAANSEFVLNKQSLQLVEKFANVSLYKNLFSCQRFFWDEKGKCDSSGISVISSLANKVTVLTSNSNSSRLIYTDVNYPGWEVYIDGTKGKIEEYENIFKSVVLSKGPHQITFLYKPMSFLYGEIVSGISVVVYFILLILLIRKKRLGRS